MLQLTATVTVGCPARLLLFTRVLAVMLKTFFAVVWATCGLCCIVAEVTAATAAASVAASRSTFMCCACV